MYGKARATGILQEADGAIRSKYVETWQYRPDLSFVPTGRPVITRDGFLAHASGPGATSSSFNFEPTVLQACNFVSSRCKIAGSEVVLALCVVNALGVFTAHSLLDVLRGHMRLVFIALRSPLPLQQDSNAFLSPAASPKQV